MATGDITFFEESLRTMLVDFDPADDIKVAILDNTTAPTASDATPTLSDYTEVGAAGSYTAGGTSIGSWNSLLTEAAGTVTFDSATNPSWAQDASNDTDAYWGLIYNDTDSNNHGLGFIELGGPVDMSSGSLTITWNASGIATLTTT